MADEKNLESINHPQYYNGHPSGVECIHIAEGFTFNLGNAIKYIWRAGLKPGANIEEDLQKAIWYIERERERLDGRASEALLETLMKIEVNTERQVQRAPEKTQMETATIFKKIFT